MIHAAFTLPLSWLLLHFADLSRLSSAALIAAIWQGTLLAAAAALALRLVPRIPAAARFAIWFAVFTLIAALPILQFAPHGSSQSATAATSHAFLNLDSRWTLAIATIWAAASVFRAVTLIAAALRVRTLSHNATPLALPTTLAARTPRRAQLCSSTDIDRPTVIGFFSPKILIPAWLLEKLTPAELDHVILHESIHLNRADDWLNLLQKFALVVFPLNPALAWVERRLCFERELACDERVLALLATRDDNHSTSYASSLTTLAEYRLQHRGLIQNLALALGALGTSASKSAPQSELARRVARILRPAARMKSLHVRIATAAAIGGLLFTTSELEHTPRLISFTAPSPAAQLATTNPGGPFIARSLRGEWGTGKSAGAPSYATRKAASIDNHYRAVSTRFVLPAAPQSKSVGDAAPHVAPHPRTLAPEPRTVPVRVTDHSAQVPQPAAARLISAHEPAPQPNLVVTRYTITAWQSSDGYRMVRTTAIVSDAPQPATPQDAPQQDVSAGSGGAASTTASPRPRQISQPYAAVPVPGGWLVFRL